MSLVGKRAARHPQQYRFRSSSQIAAVDDRSLPAADFAVLQRRFRFTVDAAASCENARLDRFWTVVEDGLSQDWSEERVYVNPPYSCIWPWVVKSWESLRAQLVVMLLPANRTEQRWWQQGIEPYRDRHWSPLRVEFLAGRQRFLSPGQKHVGPNERPPFGLCLCIWEPNGYRWEERMLF